MNWQIEDSMHYSRRDFLKTASVAAGVLAVTGNPDASSAAEARVPPGSAVGIGISCAMPVLGQTVSVERLSTVASTCQIRDPQGMTQTLRFDGQGKASWRPRHYGPHQLICGDQRRRVWVLAVPMWFHWWDGRQFPENATIVMGIRKGSAAEWKHRGVRLVCWVVGEYAHRQNSGFKPPYTKPEDWVQNWLRAKAKSKDTSGFALDEVYCGNKVPTPAIIHAVAKFRELVGPDYLITIYTSGAERGFGDLAKLLRESKALCMTESYWGDERLFRKRWLDMKQYGLEHQTLFAIGPGFRLPPSRHGPLTEAEVKTEFAKVRRVAPESPGIAIYNAYSKADAKTIQPTLDAACSRAIEDFYLKPVLHVTPGKNDETRLATLWNIGNDDAKDFALEWCDAQRNTMSEVVVPALRPQERRILHAPPHAVSLRFRPPPGFVNLYPNGLNLPV